ncbi:MAG: hypothetical protein FWD02_04020 [Bacteroidales bacterium]|nr:hypothetical protein [Bacteroidales bacterium]
MKKFILTVSLLSFFCIATYAEHFAFRIGENRSSFGVGLGWTYREMVRRDYRGVWNFPSPNVLVERSILPFRDFGFLSVGAQFGFHHGYRNANVFNTEFRESWTSFYFVPRVALYFHEVFHPYDFPENIDLYAGIGLGFNHLSHRFSNNVDPGSVGRQNNSGFKLGYHLFIGGRYYFREDFAIFAEVGYGLSFLNVGITIRY